MLVVAVVVVVVVVVVSLTNETESIDLRRERWEVCQGPAHPVALTELDSWAAFLPDHLKTLVMCAHCQVTPTK